MLQCSQIIGENSSASEVDKVRLAGLWPLRNLPALLCWRQLWNWLGRPPVLGDRFVGWGLVGCWSSYTVEPEGLVHRGEPEESSHGEGTQVLGLRPGPRLGLSLSLCLEEGFTEVGLASSLPAAWRGCQVGGEEGCEQEHPGLWEGTSHPGLGAKKEESCT